MAVKRKGYYSSKSEDNLKHTRYQLMIRNKILKYFSSLKTESVLDIGCGNGDFLIQLAEMYPDIKFIGIDFSEEAIKLALNNSACLINVNFYVLDINNLPFKDNTFDTIICINTLHHIIPDDQSRVLREMARVVKKNILIEIKNFDSFYFKYLKTEFGRQRISVAPDVYIYPTTIRNISKILNEYYYSVKKVEHIFILNFLSPLSIVLFQK